MVWPAPEMPRSLGNATWETAQLIASMQIGVMTLDDFSIFSSTVQLHRNKSEEKHVEAVEAVEVLKIFGFLSEIENIFGTC